MVGIEDHQGWYDGLDMHGTITNITIPDSVTFIGGYAFSDCTSWTSITIPNSVMSIGYGAFDNCSSLTDVYYEGSQAEWLAIDIDSYNDYLKNATIHFAKPIYS